MFKSEKYIGRPLDLTPDCISKVDAKRIEITICYKFDDKSEAEIKATYEKGKMLWYSTEIASDKAKIHSSSSRVSDLLKDLHKEL